MIEQSGGPGHRFCRTEANRSAINALGEQTAARFARLERKVDAGFIEMRGEFDQTAAGQQRIAGLLGTLIDRGDE